MTARTAPDRGTVLELLAAFGDRAPREVGEEVGSLELTWLIAQFEQLYSVVVDLDDAELARIQTVGQAADALRAVLGLPPLDDEPESEAGAGDPDPAGRT